MAKDAKVPFFDRLFGLPGFDAEEAKTAAAYYHGIVSNQHPDHSDAEERP
jgi:hypothetical protein